jgi:glyoxylase-like metal-dependent hydrolase (beta-lactamase superfamily II)
MELGPHLRRIGNDIVAAYMVETADGITVVDAGLPGHWRDLRRELDAMGRSPDDIRGLVLTHGDSDHIGFAERLRREYGTPVFVHAADAARAMGAPTPKSKVGAWRLGATTGFLAYAARKGGLHTTPLTAVQEVEDGDVLPLPGSPTIISLPGHSPGSIAVLVPEADAVFVGDALTTRNVLTGRTGPAPAPFTDDPAQALDSLQKIEHLPVAWVLPGHGVLWKATPASIVADIRAGL